MKKPQPHSQKMLPGKEKPALLSPESSGMAASHHALHTVIPLSSSISLSHALSQDWELLESRDLIFHNCFQYIQKSASPAMDTQ